MNASLGVRMSRKSKQQAFATAFCIAISLAAYPLTASFMAIIDGPDSRVPSIVTRLTAVFLTFFVVWSCRLEIKRDLPIAFVTAMGFFWAAYIFRFFYDAYIIGILESHMDPTELLSLIGLFVVIPMLTGFVGLNAYVSQRAFSMLLLVTQLTAVFLVMESAEAFVTMASQGGAGRFEVDRLNPITVGYVGGTLVILSFCSLAASRNKGKTRSLLLSLLGIVIGAFLMIVSGSRGPVVATLAVLAMYWFMPLRPGRISTGLIAIVLLISGVLLIHTQLVEYFDLDFSVRFVQALEGESASVDIRGISFNSAWDEFLKHPLFGSALLEPTTGSYPHNLILEAFMATGLFGGFAYLVCVISACLASVRLLHSRTGHEWLALMAMYYIVAAQSSGSHFSFGSHWLLIVCVVVTESRVRLQLRRHKKTGSKKQKKAHSSPQTNAQPGRYR